MSFFSDVFSGVAGGLLGGLGSKGGGGGGSAADAALVKALQSGNIQSLMRRTDTDDARKGETKVAETVEMDPMEIARHYDELMGDYDA